MIGAATGKNRLRLGLGIALMASAGLAAAEDAPPPPEDEARWYFQTSVYTRHYHEDPAHNNHQHLINIERWSAAGNGFGVALFDNSFGQPSQYVYGGKFWRPFGSAPLVHVKLTAGLLNGYKGDYQDKIPYNSRGIAPAILPSVGISGERFATEVVLLWNNGAMFTVGVFLN
jgi:hypothetical protein